MLYTPFKRLGQDGCVGGPELAQATEEAKAAGTLRIGVLSDGAMYELSTDLPSLAAAYSAAGLNVASDSAMGWLGNALQAGGTVPKLAAAAANGAAPGQEPPTRSLSLTS